VRAARRTRAPRRGDGHVDRSRGSGRCGGTNGAVAVDRKAGGGCRAEVDGRSPRQVGPGDGDAGSPRGRARGRADTGDGRRGATLITELVRAARRTRAPRGGDGHVDRSCRSGLGVERSTDPAPGGTRRESLGELVARRVGGNEATEGRG